MVATTHFNREAMAQGAPLGFSLATEIADYLVLKKIPFAQAHEAAGKCVALCESSGRQLHELSDGEYAQIHPSLDGGVRAVLTVQGALDARVTHGGTAPVQVRKQIADARAKNGATQKNIADAQKAFTGMMSL